MNNESEKINTEYVAELEEYMKNPNPPCNKEQSLKLLKRFARKDFRVLWRSSIKEYLPAVSEGTMKLADEVYEHDEAVRYAKELISTLNPKDLAKAFLYGVAHDAPEYRTALSSYYFIKNLPEHKFEKSYVGSNVNGDVYSEHICEVCQYNSQLSTEPKMQFWHINTDMESFYFKASLPFCYNLNTAIIYLKEYKRLPVPASTKEDYDLFKQIIALIESLPDNAPPSKLRKELKQSGLVKMTIDQINAFIDMLGYLNILHTDDSFGVTVGHTRECDMLYPLSDRTYFAHPVNRWTRKSGIDYEMIDMLFGGLY